MAATVNHSKEPTATNPMQQLLGSHFLGKLHVPLLVIGKDKWDRTTIGHLGVTQPVAAMRLSEIAKDVGATSLGDFIKKTNVYTFTSPRYSAGLTTLFVFLQVCKAMGYGAEMKAWRARSTEGQTIVTFTTFKRREREAASKTISPRAKADKRNKQGNFAPLKGSSNGSGKHHHQAAN